jgi:hypothetical protein
MIGVAQEGMQSQTFGGRSLDHLAVSVQREKSPLRVRTERQAGRRPLLKQGTAGRRGGDDYFFWCFIR